ncbi:hypothetical protein LVD17_13890 [Fulvivirga ulvae]|uniref:hypothetical protein n=1 Tax=Fulvivirga ulvae TaxID=2904245 RepID=UPI001F19D2BF|nr:hypothetical protein [Fulvivirga ulvae]UII34899.1 hypothetical protein LVD17_13890 [Fulvivirga ulvae]
MNTSPSFYHSALGKTANKMNVGYWPKVLEAYDNGNFKEAITGILKYIDPDLAGKTGNADQTEFNIPHGSVVVNIKIQNDRLHVEAPFIKLQNGPAVPLLRQVAELNFHPLMMTRIILDNDDQLTFHFSSPLGMCEPYKVYDALREICVNADKYDDLFIEKFQAARMREPQIQRFTTDQLDKTWQTIQEYIKEAEDYITYFEGKRWDAFLYDVFQILLMKIDFYVSPQGYLRTELENAIADLMGRDPYPDRIHRAKTFLQKLKNYDKDEFLGDIYVIETFVPYKYTFNLQTTRNNFKRGYETAQDEIKKADYLGATLTLLKDFYSLFYYNMVDETPKNLITSALERAGGTSWNDAAAILMEAMETIMNEQKYNALAGTDSVATAS